MESRPIFVGTLVEPIWTSVAKNSSLVHGRKQRLQRPVLDRREGGDLTLPLDHQTQRRALHPAGRQSVADLVPDQLRDRVADQTVDAAAGLLGVHQPVVDGPGAAQPLR